MALGSGVSQALKEASTWGVVICVVSAMAAYHQDIAAGLSQVVQYAEDQYKETLVTSSGKNTNAPAGNGFERRIEISSNRYGHYEIQARINGKNIRFLADTGATLVALTHETAESLGLNPNSLRYNGRTKTANGIAKVAHVTLDNIEVGDISVQNVQAVVAEPDNLSINLLGMSFIGQLSSVEMKEGRLILTQ